MDTKTNLITNNLRNLFFIIGTNIKDLVNEFAKAEGIKEFKWDFGVHEGNVVNFYRMADGNTIAGIEVEDLLETMTLPQIKQHFCKLVKDKLGVEVKPAWVSLYW